MEKNNFEKPNIVMIILDSARADAFSCYGNSLPTSPNIDRIAKEGVLFPNAYSTAPWTIPSHASLFTGKYASSIGMADLKSFLTVPTFIESLNNQGYKTFAYSENSLLTSFNILKDFNYIKIPLNHRIQKNLKITPEQRKSLKKDWINAATKFDFSNLVKYSYIMSKKLINMLIKTRILSHITKKKNYKFFGIPLLNKFIKTTEKSPAFLFINLCDTHYEYTSKKQNFENLAFENYKYISQNKQFKTIPLMKKLKNKKRELSESPGDCLDLMGYSKKLFQSTLPQDKTNDFFKNSEKLYLASINYSDRIIGEIYKKLEKNNLIENTIFIITSDHGEEFYEHKLMVHACGGYNTLIKIPLIIKFPKRYAITGKNNNLVSLVDIMPTIFDRLNIPYPKKNISSINFLDEKRKNIFCEAKAITHQTLPRKFGDIIFDGKYKYLGHTNCPKELFDIENDPKELNNILPKNPLLALKMERMINKIKQEISPKNPSKQIGQKNKENIKEALKNMGYL